MPAFGVAPLGAAPIDPLAVATGIDVLRGPAGTDPSAALVVRGADVITLPAPGVAALGTAGIDALVPPDVAAGVSARIDVLREPTGIEPLALVAPVADVITLPALGVAAIAAAPPFGVAVGIPDDVARLGVAAGIDVLRDPDDVAELGVAADIDVLRDPAEGVSVGAAKPADVLRDPAGAVPLVAAGALIPAELSRAPMPPDVAAPDIDVLRDPAEGVSVGVAKPADVLRDPAGAVPLVAADADLIPALFSLAPGAPPNVLRDPVGAVPLVAAAADLIPAECSLALGAPPNELRDPAGADPLVAPDADLIPALFSLAPVAPDVAVRAEPADAVFDAALLGVPLAVGLGAAAAIDVLREPAGTDALVAPDVDGWGAAGVAVARPADVLDGLVDGVA